MIDVANNATTRHDDNDDNHDDHDDKNSVRPPPASGREWRRTDRCRPTTVSFELRARQWAGYRWPNRLIANGWRLKDRWTRRGRHDGGSCRRRFKWQGGDGVLVVLASLARTMWTGLTGRRESSMVETCIPVMFYQHVFSNGRSILLA